MSKNDKPMHPVEAIRSFNRTIDKATEGLLRVYEEKGTPISCTTCTEPGCCYQKTTCWLIEALPIAERFIREGKNTPELRAKLKAAGEDMEGFDPAVWSDRQIPCVFLEDKRCSVYEDRPITPCRSYFVVTEPSICSSRDENNKTIGKIDPGEIWDLTSEFAAHVHYEFGLRHVGPDGKRDRMPNPMRIMMGSIPRTVWVWLSCWGTKDWKTFVKRQPWPTAATLAAWQKGETPFSKKEDDGTDQLSTELPIA